MFLSCFLSVQYKASKDGTVVGVAVSKVAMLTHCQALTQACNYCEGEWDPDCCHCLLSESFLIHTVVISFFVFVNFQGETLVNVLDFKKDMGLWHGVLTVSVNVWIYCMFGCVMI